MKSRSRAGATSKPRRRKPAAPKRSRGAEAARPRSSSAAGQETDIAQLNRELAQARQEQTATAEVLSIISSSPDALTAVFDTILANALRLCEADTGHVLCAEADTLSVAAMRGGRPEYAQFWRERGPWRPPPDSAPAQAMDQKKPVQIADMSQTSSYATGGRATVAAVELGGLRTVLMVPMIAHENAIGIIVIYRGVVRPFSDKQIALVQNFAAQAVIAIENTRLLTELHESLQQQTATAEILSSISSSIDDAKPVFDAIATNLLSLFGTRFAVVGLVRDNMLEMVGIKGDPGFEKLAERYPVPLDGSTHVTKALLTGRTLQLVPIIDNSEAPPGTAEFAREFGYNAQIATPMLRQRKAIGAFVTAKRDAVPFSDKQVGLIEAFADQAVIAIENTRLLTELRESLDRQTATADILRVIAGAPEDSQHALDTIADTASRMFDAANVIFRRLEGNVLRVVSAAGPSFAKLREVIPDAPLEPETDRHEIFRGIRLTTEPRKSTKDSLDLGPSRVNNAQSPRNSAPQ
jgi:GAF domain-containing protein